MLVWPRWGSAGLLGLSNLHVEFRSQQPVVPRDCGRGVPRAGWQANVLPGFIWLVCPFFSFLLFFHSLTFFSFSRFLRFVKRVTDIIYELFLLLVYLLQTFLISFIPLFGRPASCVCFCWLYAFYSFELAIFLLALNVDSSQFLGVQVQMDESRLESGKETRLRRDSLGVLCRIWFASFYSSLLFSSPLTNLMLLLLLGFPGTLLTIFFPQFINSGIFALVFPMVSFS